MAEGRGREEDAFERAAAELVPAWADSIVPPPPAAKDPISGSVRLPDAQGEAPSVRVEPSIMVQPELAVAAAPGAPPAARPSGIPAHDAAVAVFQSPVPSSFGVPSAFSPAQGAPANLPANTRMGFPTPDMASAPTQVVRFEDIQGRPSKQKPNVKLIAIGGAVCLAIALLVASLRSSDEPVATDKAPAASTTTSVVPAIKPAVQPLPAITTGATSQPGRAAKPGVDDAPSARTAAQTSANKPVRPVAVPKKKVAAPMVKAKVPAKAQPIKPAPSKAAAVATKPAVKAQKAGAATKANAAKKPVQPATKRERSPIDVLNPWAN